MNTSSPTFLQFFYQAIHEWIVAGLPEDPVRNPYGFKSDAGLCTNMVYFSRSQGCSNTTICMTKEHMNILFKRAGLSAVFPFGDLLVYDQERKSKTIFQNQQRLDWIKDHV